MYAYYAETKGKILQNDRTLHNHFPKSVFGAATFNLGPKVNTCTHLDHLNLPAGWCAIVALGEFDASEGGHLILWDLNLMIEFPAGSLIFLPSALLLHSNTQVAGEGTRASFTQYSAGALFRWVDCGFKTQKQFEAEGGVWASTGEERWASGTARLSTLDEWQSMFR